MRGINGVRTMILTVLLGPIILIACSDYLTDPPGSGDEAKFRFFANTAGTTAEELVVTITAPDIDPPLVYNLAVVNDTASGTVEVPPGPNRTFTLVAYDGNGLETHRGDTTVTVVSGTNPTLQMTLDPQTGQQPIEATMGTYAVSVAPTVDTVFVDDTTRLAATVLNPDGDTVNARVRWATADPGIAVVDTMGLVTGRTAGSVEIVATYGGVAGLSTITVIDQIGGSSKIAFTADNGTDDIYIMHANGSNIVPLLEDSTLHEAWPAWSPDGTKLAYVADPANSLSNDRDIYVINADGTNPIALTNDTIVNTEPDWSPTGDRIAFVSDRDGGRNIYVMNADGTGVTQLTFSYDIMDPDWSPDGTKIAYSQYDGVAGTSYIYVMNADGSGATQLAEGYFPDWSPDGTTIAFEKQAADSVYSIYVMNADGTGITRLTSGAHRYQPSWSADGTRIATSCAGPDGFDQICSMNADGTDENKLTSGSTWYHLPAYQW